MTNCNRYKNDICYDLLVPPWGLDYYNMSSKQARENFEWYISKIPERTEYFQKRCATDLKVPVNEIDYSAKSLIIVWNWFLNIARTEKVSKSEMKAMKDMAELFGESSINKDKFTVATHFIMRDIGMYVGQTFIRNYPQLYWTYYTKPKNEVNVKQPVIAGFYYKDELTEGEMTINPMNLVEGAAANIFDKTCKQTDLYNSYIKTMRWVPELR